MGLGQERGSVQVGVSMHGVACGGLVSFLHNGRWRAWTEEWALWSFLRYSEGRRAEEEGFSCLVGGLSRASNRHAEEWCSV